MLDVDGHTIYENVIIYMTILTQKSGEDEELYRSKVFYMMEIKLALIQTIFL